MKKVVLKEKVAVLAREKFSRGRREINFYAQDFNSKFIKYEL